jgi:hypothetical protein
MDGPGRERQGELGLGALAIIIWIGTSAVVFRSSWGEASGEAFW